MFIFNACQHCCVALYQFIVHCIYAYMIYQVVYKGTILFMTTLGCCLLLVLADWFPNGSLPGPPASILLPNPISPPLHPSFNPFPFNAKQCNTMGSVTLDRNTVIFNFQDFLSPTLSFLKISETLYWMTCEYLYT